MTSLLSNIIGKNQYKFFLLRQTNLFNVMPIGNYQKLVKELDHCKVSHSFQLKQESASRIVVQVLHPTTLLYEIRETLLNFGHIS